MIHDRPPEVRQDQVVHGALLTYDLSDLGACLGCKLIVKED